MKNPRLEKFRKELKTLTPHAADSALLEVLQALDVLPMYVPEPYDLVRVNVGQGEQEYGIVISYDPVANTVAVALTFPARGEQRAGSAAYHAALGEVSPATPEQARAYAEARAYADAHAVAVAST